jgi:hypothetical protein
LEKELLEQVHAALNGFSVITLAQMDSVKLMDRMDVKYVVPLHLLPNILQVASAKYHVLEVEGKRASAYKSLYYDDELYSSYYNHQNGRLNRYKIRQRMYVDSALTFFEIKYKNNKKRTIKKRIKQENTELGSLQSNSMEFLKQNSTLIPEQIKPSIWVNYNRITLVHKTNIERVTVDLDLTFVDNQNHANYSNIAIVEVKQDRNAGSDITDIFKNFSVRPGSISKYCLGMMSLHTGLKQNRFKKKFLHLKKIQNQYDTFSNTAS